MNCCKPENIICANERSNSCCMIKIMMYYYISPKAIKMVEELYRSTMNELVGDDLFTPPFSCSSAPYLWHVYVFILVQFFEDPSIGTFAWVMVLQLANLVMMDTEVCILSYDDHRRARIKRTNFCPWCVQRAQSKCFPVELLPSTLSA